jgi:hypothetical protein
MSAHVHVCILLRNYYVCLCALQPTYCCKIIMYDCIICSLLLPLVRNSRGRLSSWRIFRQYEINIRHYNRPQANFFTISSKNMAVNVVRDMREIVHCNLTL